HCVDRPRYRSSLFVLLDNPQTAGLYTLSLHDALPILIELETRLAFQEHAVSELSDALAEARLELARNDALLRRALDELRASRAGDRKSTRLNSSHVKISYAVFCLKKKKKNLDSKQPIT